MSGLYQTGLFPDLASAREADQSERLFYGGGSLGTDAIVQAIAWIRAQLENPSCVGQAVVEPVDVMLGRPPWASAVSAWREARRRQGRIEQITEGTRFQYALEGLVRRGWDPYRPGEDSDPEEAGLGAPDAGDDLADELFADDHIDLQMERFRIMSAVLEQVDTALASDMGVVIGTGTRAAYQRYQGDPSKPDQILNTNHLGGGKDGHGERVFARVVQLGGRRIYGIQNSWGPEGAIVCAPEDARAGGWGGMHLPDGSWAPGCCWVDESVLLEAWDIHVFRPRR